MALSIPKTADRTPGLLHPIMDRRLVRYAMVSAFELYCQASQAAGEGIRIEDIHQVGDLLHLTGAYVLVHQL